MSEDRRLAQWATQLPAVSAYPTLLVLVSIVTSWLDRKDEKREKEATEEKARTRKEREKAGCNNPQPCTTVPKILVYQRWRSSPLRKRRYFLYLFHLTARAPWGMLSRVTGITWLSAPEWANNIITPIRPIDISSVMEYTGLKQLQIWHSDGEVSGCI